MKHKIELLKQKIESIKPKLELIKTILTWSIVALSVIMVIFTIFTVTTLNREDRGIFGFKFLIVTSDSMKKTDFDAGDLIFIKKIKDPSTLQPGDIISFISTNPDNAGSIVTHKIRRLAEDSRGNPGFVTYGTSTDTDDERIVLYKNVIGLYRGRIPDAGYFFSFLRTPLGYVLCILIPFLLLIGSQAYQTIQLLRENKKEEREQMENELEKLRLEQEKNEQMIAELQKLAQNLKKELDETNTDTE